MTIIRKFFRIINWTRVFNIQTGVFAILIIIGSQTKDSFWQTIGYGMIGLQIFTLIGFFNIFCEIKKTHSKTRKH